MNILILNWRDIRHPLAGGAEISTHEHAKGWAKAGHQVTVFASSFKEAKSKEIIDGVTYVRRGSHFTVHIYAFLYYSFTAHRAFDLVVDEFHFIPFFTPLYVTGRKLAFIHETAEEIWFKNRSFPVSYIGYYLEPLFFFLYKRIQFMTVSRSTKNDLVKFGITAQNIHIIHNGIHPISVGITKSIKPVIIYLGRIARDKGIDDALDTFGRVHKLMSNAQLWVVGKEEIEGKINQLKTTAGRLKLVNAVKFFNYVSESKKYFLLKKAWILLHPSVKEGWGLTVIEAASQGTPTVAYKVGGLSDSIISGETGTLVGEMNPEALSKAIVQLSMNKAYYEKMSASATAWSKQFDWKNSIKDSIKLIESIV